MSIITLIVWVAYAAVLILLSRWASQKDSLLPGKVGSVVQAFAFAATYVSAVALVGFGGLCHRMGLQMLLIAAGNVWLGTWFVYRYLAWPTRVLQKKLDARTPAELIAKAYETPKLQPFLGAVSACLLILYGSAVFKGAALMLSAAIPLPLNVLLALLVFIVGISVTWGGLRGVLYTEAFQGFIMVLGVASLLFSVLAAVGGPIEGVRALAALPPDNFANNGFAALSSGGEGLNIIFLTIVMSAGVWAQPQLMQRHFALRSHEDAGKVAPVAMLILALVVGGAYFLGSLSRLILGPDAGSPDVIIPTLVSMLLPEWGRQLFVLAVVSASLSTASAILHVVSSALGKDVLGRNLAKKEWMCVVCVSAVLSGTLATISNSLIAFVCSTSWTVIACSAMIPYLTLLFGPKLGSTGVWGASLAGTFGSIAWYLAGYAPTAGKLTGIVAPGMMGQIHPFAIGITCSLLGAAVGYAIKPQKLLSV